MEKSKGAILLVANFSNNTGYAWNNIYRLFDVIGEFFTRRGHDVHVSFAKLTPPVTNFTKSNYLLFHEYDPHDASFYSTIRLCKIIVKNEIKYIYFTDQKAFDYRYAFLRLFCGVRSIVMHDRVSVPCPYPATYHGGVKGFLKSLLGRWDFICPDRIYAVSEFVRNRLIKANRLPEWRIVKILNGIDIHRFRAPTIEISPGVPKVLKVFVGGRATRHKGIQVLIHAAAAIKDQVGSGFVVRYAGDGPDIEYLRNLVESSGLRDQFVFLGELPSTDGEVSAADIIVVPSIWGDACPSTVSEALASGVPLIATSVGGVPEMIGGEGNAIIVAPNNVGELSSGLIKLLSSASLRREIGRNGRIRAEEVFDESIYHLKVINQICCDFDIVEL